MDLIDEKQYKTFRNSIKIQKIKMKKRWNCVKLSFLKIDAIDAIFEETIDGLKISKERYERQDNIDRDV